MTLFFQKYKRDLIGITLGAVAGFLYWKFVGCSSGTCMITSKPINSTLYGALMGFLVVGIFKKNKKGINQNTPELSPFLARPGLPASLRSLSSSKVALPKAFQTQIFDLRLSFLTLIRSIKQACFAASH